SAGLLLQTSTGATLRGGTIVFGGQRVAAGSANPLSRWSLDGVTVVGFAEGVDAQGNATDTFRLRATVVGHDVVLASDPSGTGFHSAWNSATNTGTTPSNFGRQVVPGSFTTATGTVSLSVLSANHPPTTITLSPTFADPND